MAYKPHENFRYITYITKKNHSYWSYFKQLSDLPHWGTTERMAHGSTLSGRSHFAMLRKGGLQHGLLQELP